MVSAGSNAYCYDENGNQVKRTIGGNVYNLSVVSTWRSNNQLYAEVRSLNHALVTLSSTTLNRTYDGVHYVETQQYGGGFMPPPLHG